jgi:diketogulonate reductase-like aldo/keto reductase
MVLGTCNFNHEYNGSFLSKENALKILDYFYANGGRIIDTAFNYHGNDIIKEWLKNNPGNELKIITKIWKSEELYDCLEKFSEHGLSYLMIRNSKDDHLFNYSRQFNSCIKKIGTSIYYPNELRQDVNAFHIPASPLFIDYLDTMLLHADVFVRSLFNMNNKNIGHAIDNFEVFKRHERIDLNHHVYPVIGVSNIGQLKENMEWFK